MRVEIDNREPIVMFISSEKAQVSIEAYRSACYSIYFPCHKDAVDIAAALGFSS